MPARKDAAFTVAVVQDAAVFLRPRRVGGEDDRPGARGRRQRGAAGPLPGSVHPRLSARVELRGRRRQPHGGGPLPLPPLRRERAERARPGSATSWARPRRSWGFTWPSVVIEQAEVSAGTLYCTLLYFGPDGELCNQAPQAEADRRRALIWGEGDGSTLHGDETTLGRLGGLICWENYMPLARTAHVRPRASSSTWRRRRTRARAGRRRSGTSRWRAAASSSPATSS